MVVHVGAVKSLWFVRPSLFGEVPREEWEAELLIVLEERNYV